MSEFSEEELDRAEFYFDDDKREITIIVRGGGSDMMYIDRCDEVEYFKRKLVGR